MQDRFSRFAIALAVGLASSLPALAADEKLVAISTIVETPALNETREGVILALEEAGFIEGENLKIDYQNANGNMPTQQQIAQKFVGEGADVIVAITTPTGQAMASATSDIPIVFASVADPLKAKLIPQYAKPGGNITGISDAAPIGKQVDLIREILPEIKSIGYVYNPGLDNAVITLEWLKETSAEYGIEVVASPAPTPNEVVPATRKLVGKVNAIYVPNDTTVVASLEAVIKVGQDTHTPIFAGETGAVHRGVVASVGLNYISVGKVAGQMVADVLNGTAPGEIDAVLAYNLLDEFKVVVNLGAADSMGVKLPESLLLSATEIIE